MASFLRNKLRFVRHSGLPPTNTGMLINPISLCQQYLSRLNDIDWWYETRLIVAATLLGGVMYVSSCVCSQTMLSFLITAPASASSSLSSICLPGPGVLTGLDISSTPCNPSSLDLPRPRCRKARAKLKEAYPEPKFARHHGVSTTRPAAPC